MRQWCELWDHLIANASDPSLLLFAVVAYVMFFRVALLAIVPSRKQLLLLRPLGCSRSYRRPVFCSAAAESEDKSSRDEVQAFCRHQNAINMSQFLKTMYALRKATPAHYLANNAAGITTPADVPGTLPVCLCTHLCFGTDAVVLYLVLPGMSMGSRVYGPGGVSTRPGDLPVGTAADIASCAAAGPGPAYILPVGQYPPFTRFPKFVVDFQLQERERIELEERSVLAKRKLSEVVAQRK